MNKKGITAIINKLLCVFLALFMIVSLMPEMVLADGDSLEPTIVVFESPEEVAPLFKQAVMSRAETMTFSIRFYPDENEDMWIQTVQLVGEINNLMQEHNGNPLEGTSLRYWGRPNVSSTNGFTLQEEGDHYINTITVEFDYMLTAEQEEELTEAIDQLMVDLDIYNKTDYEKIKAIYDYVTSTVKYEFTQYDGCAYGPMIEKKGICQGISHLMYRLLLTAGIDVRFITGYASDGVNDMTHVWNIVKLGDYYYNIDATWDLSDGGDSYSHNWFLLGSKSFFYDRYQHERHKRAAYYASEEFTSVYPMSPLDYGDESLWIEEGNTYDLTVEAGELRSVTFEPAKSGRYTLSTSNAGHLVSAEIDPYFAQETVERKESNVGNDISYVYKLVKGNRYTVYVGLDDSSQADSFSISLTKNPVEERTIVSATSEESIFYYTGTGSQIINDQSSYMYYDVKPRDMAVTLDDGTVLRGTFDEVLDVLDDVYEIYPDYSFEGDDQSCDDPWGAGVYDIALSFDGFILDYQVEIAENPITSVTIDVDHLAYDDELSQRDGLYYYNFDIDHIEVTTVDRTYQGDYDSVYQEISADYPLYFEYQPSIQEVFYSSTLIGTHECTATLFGVETPFNVEIRHNPVDYIRVLQDRTVTENDRYEAIATVLDENGQETTVSYLAYPHEPSEVRVKLKDGTQFSGTVDEVMTYLGENYDYHEVFRYDDIDSYDDRWGIGSHPVTISLRNASWTYNVIVTKSEYVPLELESETAVTIPGEETELFSFSVDALDNVCGFYMDSYEGLTAYLYDSNMELLTDNENREPGENPLISYYFDPNKTHYLVVRNNGNEEKEVKITPRMIFKLSYSSSNVDTVLYENQAVLKEEIYNGEPVSYMWHDWNPTLSLWFSTLGSIEGTLGEIAARIREEYDIELVYSIDYNDGYTDLQSYEHQWTVEPYSAQAVLAVYNKAYSYSLTINPGPILSLDTEDVIYAAGSGTEESVADAQGAEHTYMHYDAMPRHLTAHTVDGDISGTPKEIVNYIHDTYGIMLDTGIEGDDQSYQNPWGVGTHEMTFRIGNVSAPYDVTIESISKAYIPLGGVGGDSGYYVHPATEEGLNGKNYGILNDNGGYYYETADGDTVYFRVDVKKGFDASGLSVAFNGSPVTLYTADGLMAAYDVEFTPATEDGIGMSRYFVLNAGGDGNILVSGVGIARLQGVAQIYGGSLTLDGEIGVNIYVTIPNEVFADKGAYAMVNDKKVLLSGVPYQTTVGMKLYRFSYFLQSTEMNDAVVLRLYGSDDSLITLYSFAGEEITESGYSYSVRDYINRVTESYTQSPQLKALVNALSDYGSLAQVQFGYHEDQAAAIVEQEALDAVTLETLEPLAYTTEGTLPEGLSYYGSNLVLDSKTTLKHYFTLGSGHDISEYRFTVGGEEYAPERAGTYYYVEIPNITAKELDERYPVRITPAGDDSAYYELQYSALSYARQVMLHSSEDALRQLVKGLYLYSLAAEAHFGG